METKREREMLFRLSLLSKMNISGIAVQKNPRWSPSSFLFHFSLAVRFVVLPNNYLQIRGIKKTDEGMYRCEGRILARGEVDFRDIHVIVNGELGT